jgi:phosphoglycerate dehydrogenase-like enzyme
MIIVLDEAYRQGCRGRLAGHDLRYFASSVTDPAPIADLLVDADVAGFRRILPFAFHEDMVERAHRLQFIQRSGSGADWFPLARLSELGILVAVNSGFNAPSVAEHAVTLALLCLRRTLGYVDTMARGQWVRDLPGDPPFMLNGRTVGVIGVGNVGLRVARAMIGLGASVICWQPDTSAPLPDGATWSTFDQVISTADVITLHVPLVTATRGMIGKREIAKMKPTAVLINTARGPVVDQAALIDALKQRRLRAAGLDVFEDEPLDPRHELRSMANVVVTPHVGGAGIEIAERQVEGTISNLERFVEGERPQRLVNPEILEQGRARARHLNTARS